MGSACLLGGEKHNRDNSVRSKLSRRSIRVTAAITAGGPANDSFANSQGVAVKALVIVDGATLLSRSIAAAKACGATRIVVIGGSEVRAACAAEVDIVIPEAGDGRENIRRAIASSEGEPLLLMSSDMPFITGEAVVDFFERGRAFDLALPLAEARDYLLAYPGAPDHITKIGRDRVANGSVVFFGAGVAPRALDVAQRLFDARKSLPRMASLLGPQLLARFIFGTLSIEHVERRGTTLLGLEVRAIRHASPALCFDIDTEADLAYARAYAARR